MPLNDSPDEDQAPTETTAMRRRPPKNGRPPRDGGICDKAGKTSQREIP